MLQLSKEIKWLDRNFRVCFFFWGERKGGGFTPNFKIWQPIHRILVHDPATNHTIRISSERPKFRVGHWPRCDYTNLPCTMYVNRATLVPQATLTQESFDETTEWPPEEFLEGQEKTTTTTTLGSSVNQDWTPSTVNIIRKTGEFNAVETTPRQLSASSGK